MARLGDICVINPKTPVLDDSMEVSFVPMAKVGENGEFDATDIREYREVKKGFTSFQNGDILFAKITPCMENGKGAIACCMKNGIGFGSTEFHVLRPKNENLLSGWLYYLLSWPVLRKEAEKNMTGSAGQKRVPKSFLENYDVILPVIEEQEKQIRALNRIDKLLLIRKQQLAKFDELVKSRFVELFGACNCRISTFGKEFSFISRGKSPSYVELSDLAVINQACIYWNGLNFDKVKYNDVSYSGDRILQFGDVLVNSTGTGTLGRANIFMRRSADKRYMADSHVTIIRGSVSCHPVYIKWYLEQAKIQDAIYRNCVSGSTNQIELSKEKFKELELPVPPMTLQQQFAAFVEQTDKSKFEIQQSLEKLEILKKALMQKYFG